MEETRLQQAMRAMASRDPMVRQRVSLELGTLADASVAADLVDLLVAEDDPYVRETLTWVIVGQAPTTVPHLIEALDSQSPARAAVLHALSKIRDDACVPHVLPLVDDPHPGVAAKAWWVLGRMAVPESAPTLLAQLGRHSDENLKADLTRALQFLGASAVPGLAEALRSDDPAVAHHAGEALVAIGKPAIEALDALVETALGEDRSLAVLALEAMVPLDTPTVDSLYAELKNSDDAWLSTLAAWFTDERAELQARAARIAAR